MLSTFTVTNKSDSGTGSLRQAIIGSNAATGAAANNISFNIPGGVAIISPLTPLPALTQAVVLDGTTEPGTGSAPRIVLNGSHLTGPTAVGLTLNAPNSTIKGLAIDSFAADGLLLNGVSGTVISGTTSG